MSERFEYQVSRFKFEADALMQLEFRRRNVSVPWLPIDVARRW